MQDAIAMSIICQQPQNFVELMADDNITVEMKSRVRHSYFIMKRHISDVGRHLMIIGEEHAKEHTVHRVPFSVTSEIRANRAATAATTAATASAATATAPVSDEQILYHF